MKTSSHQHHYRPGLRIPDECRVQARRVVDNRTLLLHRGEARSHVMRDMREDLADFVSHARLREEERGFETEFRMDLFVFNPDEFWEVVETEVQRQLSLVRDLHHVVEETPA